MYTSFWTDTKSNAASVIYSLCGFVSVTICIWHLSGPLKGGGIAETDPDRLNRPNHPNRFVDTVQISSPWSRTEPPICKFPAGLPELATHERWRRLNLQVGRYTFYCELSVEQDDPKKLLSLFTQSGEAMSPHCMQSLNRHSLFDELRKWLSLFIQSVGVMSQDYVETWK